MKLNILHIDTRRDDARAAVAELRRRLSPEGNVVSEAGRRRTLEVFGEALSPQQVVVRICRDVKEKGLAAVLDYSRRIDNAELTPDGIRVPAEELDRAHAAAEPEFLAAVRSVRRRIDAFQRAILLRDVRVDVPDGCSAAALSPVGSRGNLRARRGGGVSLDRADDGRAGASRGREGTGRRRPANPLRGLQPRPAGRLPRAGHRGSLSPRRGPGRGRLGLRRRRDSAGGQDRRAGQPLCRLGKEARLRRGGHRFDRRSQRGGRARRSFDAAGIHGGRSDRPGRARPGRERLDRLGRSCAGRRRRPSWAGSWPAWSGASWRGRVSKSSGR